MSASSRSAIIGVPLLILLTLAAWADAPENALPRLQRIWLDRPEARPAWTSDGSYIETNLTDFDEIWRRAERRSKTEAEFRPLANFSFQAVIVGGNIWGLSRWELPAGKAPFIHCADDWPTWLGTPRWATGEKARFGVVDGNRSVLEIPTDRRHPVLHAAWRTPGVQRGTRTLFELVLPKAATATLLLHSSPALRLSALDGTAVLLLSESTWHRTWQISSAALGRRVRLVAEPSQAVGLAARFRVSTYVEPEPNGCRARFLIEGREPPTTGNLRLTGSQGLKIQSVRALGTEPFPWNWVVTPEGELSIHSLHWPPSGVKFEVDGFVVSSPAAPPGQQLSLPRLTLPEDTQATEIVQVRPPPGFQIEWVAGKDVWMPSAQRLHPLASLVWAWNEAPQGLNRPQYRLWPEETLWQLQQQVHWCLDAVGQTVLARLTWRAERGQDSLLRIGLPPGFKLEDVQNEATDAPALRWYLSDRSPSDLELTIFLPRAQDNVGRGTLLLKLQRAWKPSEIWPPSLPLEVPLPVPRTTRLQQQCVGVSVRRARDSDALVPAFAVLREGAWGPACRLPASFPEWSTQPGPPSEGCHEFIVDGPSPKLRLTSLAPTVRMQARVASDAEALRYELDVRPLQGLASSLGIRFSRPPPALAWQVRQGRNQVLSCERLDEQNFRLHLERPLDRPVVIEAKGNWLANESVPLVWLSSRGECTGIFQRKPQPGGERSAPMGVPYDADFTSPVLPVTAQPQAAPEVVGVRGQRAELVWTVNERGHSNLEILALVESTGVNDLELVLSGARWRDGWLDADRDDGVRLNSPAGHRLSQGRHELRLNYEPETQSLGWGLVQRLDVTLPAWLPEREQVRTRFDISDHWLIWGTADPLKTANIGSSQRVVRLTAVLIPIWCFELASGLAGVLLGCVLFVPAWRRGFRWFLALLGLFVVPAFAVYWSLPWTQLLLPIFVGGLLVWSTIRVWRLAARPIPIGIALAGMATAVGPIHYADAQGRETQGPSVAIFILPAKAGQPQRCLLPREFWNRLRKLAAAHRPAEVFLDSGRQMVTLTSEGGRWEWSGTLEARNAGASILRWRLPRTSQVQVEVNEKPYSAWTNQNGQIEVALPEGISKLNLRAHVSGDFQREPLSVHSPPFVGQEIAVQSSEGRELTFMPLLKEGRLPPTVATGLLRMPLPSSGAWELQWRASSPPTPAVLPAYYIKGGLGQWQVTTEAVAGTRASPGKLQCALPSGFSLLSVEAQPADLNWGWKIDPVSQAVSLQWQPSSSRARFKIVGFACESRLTACRFWPQFLTSMLCRNADAGLAALAAVQAEPLILIVLPKWQQASLGLVHADPALEWRPMDLHTWGPLQVGITGQLLVLTKQPLAESECAVSSELRLSSGAVESRCTLTFGRSSLNGTVSRSVELPTGSQITSISGPAVLEWRQTGDRLHLVLEQRAGSKIEVTTKFIQPITGLRAQTSWPLPRMRLPEISRLTERFYLPAEGGLDFAPATNLDSRRPQPGPFGGFLLTLAPGDQAPNLRLPAAPTFLPQRITIEDENRTEEKAARYAFSSTNGASCELFIRIDNLADGAALHLVEPARGGLQVVQEEGSTRLVRLFAFGPTRRWQFAIIGQPQKAIASVSVHQAKPTQNSRP